MEKNIQRGLQDVISTCYHRTCVSLQFQLTLRIFYASFPIGREARRRILELTILSQREELKTRDSTQFK